MVLRRSLVQLKECKNSSLLETNLFSSKNEILKNLVITFNALVNFHLKYFKYFY